MTLILRQVYSIQGRGFCLEIRQCRIHSNRLDVSITYPGQGQPSILSIPNLTQSVDLPTLTWENYVAFKHYSDPHVSLSEPKDLSELMNRISSHGLNGLNLILDNRLIQQTGFSFGESPLERLLYLEEIAHCKNHEEKPATLYLIARKGNVRDLYQPEELATLMSLYLNVAKQGCCHPSSELEAIAQGLLEHLPDVSWADLVNDYLKRPEVPGTNQVKRRLGWEESLYNSSFVPFIRGLITGSPLSVAITLVEPV